MKLREFLRRGYEMAKITKMENGKYQVQVYDTYGNRHRLTFDKKGDADAYITKIETVKHDNRLVKVNLRKQRITFDLALEDFKLSKSQLRPKSIQKYNGVIYQFGKFVEANGIIYLDEFTVDHATALYNELVKEKPDPTGNSNRMVKPKPKTVNFYLMTIKAFFREEVIKQRILRSPMLHIKNLRVEKKRPDYYTEGELKIFFQQEMPEAYRNAFIGLLHTGCRIAELANLTWAEVDIDKKIIHIKSTDDFKTKTSKSERAIPMNDILYNLLVKMSADKKSDKYPFCSKEGNQLRERTLLDECKKIAAKAGIVSRAFLHKFRSSFASHLVQNDISIEKVSELLGHTTIAETQMHYARQDTHRMHEAVNKLNELGKAAE